MWPAHIVGAQKTHGIKVALDDGDLGASFGYYRGCAACPWASSMDVTTTDLQPHEYPYGKLDDHDDS